MERRPHRIAATCPFAIYKGGSRAAKEGKPAMLGVHALACLRNHLRSAEVTRLKCLRKLDIFAEIRASLPLLLRLSRHLRGVRGPRFTEAPYLTGNYAT